MSPPAIILHQAGFNSFMDGEAATVGLETLAEGGNPDMLITEATSASEHLMSMRVDPVPPLTIGAGNSISIPVTNIDNVRLTLLTMLVDTNDAFTGTNALDISNMAVGAKKVVNAPTWDSGTEANTETADTIPGPAAQQAGGAAEGFNAARDDLIDRVHFHPGAVTSANSNDPSREGLSTSVLTEIDRWDNPASQIVITRTQ